MHWAGYPDSDDQWINWDNTEGAQEAIREFKRSNPDCEVHIKASIALPNLSSVTRIRSMSTSPSLTTSWNFDTLENHATWDAVTCPSSYSTPAVTYNTNNNNNNAVTYNDHHRGRRSPGVNSDILDAMTTLRDVEEAKAYFPTPSPRCISEDSTGRPPVLEDGSGGMGGQLLIQSVRMTGEKTGVASPSTSKFAGHTPCPNAAILFGSGNEEDNNIQCG
jgi:hypothetical protein